jgi:uncharacterized cupredoxin-like copper-binding protein
VKGKDGRGRLWAYWARLGGVALLTGVLAGVGVADSPAQVEAQVAVQTVRVELREWEIVPRTLTLRAGQRYRFELVNTGQFRHALEFKDIPGGRSPDVMSGQTGTFEFTFTAGGPLEVYCPIACPGPNCHRDRGMLVRWNVLGAAVGQVPRGLPRTGGAALPLAGLLALGASLSGLVLHRLRRSV